MLNSDDIRTVKESWTRIRASQKFNMIVLRNSVLLNVQEVLVSTKTKLSQEFRAVTTDSSMQLCIFGPINLDIQVGDRFQYYDQAAIVTNVQPHRLFQTTAYAEVST